MRLLLGMALIAGTTVAVPPASATGPLVLRAGLQMSCFGCGWREDGLMQGRLVGFANGAPVNEVFASDFGYDEPAATCPTEGYGWMRFEPYGHTLSWSRLGTTVSAMIVAGDGVIVGGGEGTFVVTSPLGNPCGRSAVAEMDLTIAYLGWPS